MNRKVFDVEQVKICPTCFGAGVIDCIDACLKVFKDESPCGGCPLVESGAVECPTCEGIGYLIELRKEVY